MRSSQDQKSLNEIHDIVDWDADDSGMLGAKIKYTGEITQLEYEWDDVNLDIHTDDQEVYIVGTDEGTDDWTDFSFEMDPDTAETIAQQLHFAAKMARDGRGSDIRT